MLTLYLIAVLLMFITYNSYAVGVSPSPFGDVYCENRVSVIEGGEQSCGDIGGRRARDTNAQFNGLCLFEPPSGIPLGSCPSGSALEITVSLYGLGFFETRLGIPLGKQSLFMDYVSLRSSCEHRVQRFVPFNRTSLRHNLKITVSLNGLYSFESEQRFPNGSGAFTKIVSITKYIVPTNIYGKSGR